MRNPIRSEADAFRLLVIVASGALAVIVVAVAVGGLAGAVLALALLTVGGYRAWAAYGRGGAADDSAAGSPPSG